MAAVSCTFNTALDATGLNADLYSKLGVSATQLSVLGSAFDSSGNRYDCCYDNKGDNLVVDPNGQAAPTKDETTLAKWAGQSGAHYGHALTHLGTCKDSTGASADVWFCQSDKKVLWDANPV